MGMNRIESVEQLQALYGEPGEASLVKVTDRLTAPYRVMIETSPFAALATIGPEGLDCSPRGDRGSLVSIRDERTLLLPDRRGNNRIDSLVNIVRDPRVALMFVVPGSNSILRVNGTAFVSADPDLLESLAVEGKAPRSVVVITIAEVYFQCARALMRADLWNPATHVDPKALPTAGAMLKAASRYDFDAETYDREWPERARRSMW